MTPDSLLENDLNEIIDRIGAGRAIPERFYRAGIDRDPDELLDTLGIMHLHLGNRGSDELLFLVQYSERVVLLEINSHKHFATEPKGTLLAALHERHLTRLAQEGAKADAAKTAERAARIGKAMEGLRTARRTKDR